MTRLLVTGRTGRLGWELQSTLAPLGTVIALDRGQLDLASADSIRSTLREHRPEVIVNAAGYTTVDKAETDAELAMRVNGVAPGIMAEEAKRLGALLVHYSTDYVYDGVAGRTYSEDAAPLPLNVYGASKLAGDRAIAATGATHLILRTSWIYSARGVDFVKTILRLARERPELSVVEDQTGSPTWARSLAQATADLLSRRDRIPERGGIYHLSASGHVSRYEFAKAAIRIMREISGLDDGWAEIKPITSDQYPLPARRPPNPITDKSRIKRVFGMEMPHWESQLRNFLSEYSARGGN